MKIIPLVLVLASLSAAACMPVRADWDAALEAREAAQRKAEAQEAARRKAEMDRTMREAEAKSIRSYYGAKGTGKSDAELKRQYDAEISQAQKASKGDAAARAAMNPMNAQQRAQADAGMKGMTGKSMKDIERMNEAELEAFGREMEKKHGVK